MTVKTACRLADSPTTDRRAEELVPVVDGVYQLLDSLHRSPLGDTPLPTNFDASWKEEG